MAELLIRVVDKRNHDDAGHDRLCSKAGDVIAVCPDGWKWGREELANPEWAIVHLPKIPHEQFIDMLKPLYDSEGAMVLKREHHFLPAVVDAMLEGGKRHRLSPSQRDTLLSARIAKQAPGRIRLGK